jgi:hypothetical protein
MAVVYLLVLYTQVSTSRYQVGVMSGGCFREQNFNANQKMCKILVPIVP